MSYQFENHPEMARKLNDKAREEMKLKLLRDIRMDIEVCKIEGLNYKDYLLQLKEIIDGFLRV